MNKLLRKALLFSKVILLPKNKYKRLPQRNTPDSYIKKVNSKGKIIQIRHYGNDGYVEFDIDFSHHNLPTDHPQTFGGAHKHIYDHMPNNTRRHGPALELTYEEYIYFILNHKKIQAEIIYV